MDRRVYSCRGICIVSQSTDLESSSSRLQCLTCKREFSLADGLKFCPDDESLLCFVGQDRLINTVLDGKYEILRQIGFGGYGRVYVARHIYTDRTVAVKVMTQNFDQDPVMLDRFNSEARVSNQLHHANIVGALDHGVEPQPYIIMEYVEGETLEERLKSSGTLSLQEFFKIFDEVCRAMSTAHQAGCLHRDLKPSNIMIDKKSGQAKILDFGLVKMHGQDLTCAGEVIGSPPYMSPEQCRGMEVDQRSDIYSLGCVMYEALTGVKAFDGKTSVDTMYKHFNTTPAPISSLRKDWIVPRGLDYVIGRSLADLNDRYKTVEELQLDLARVCSGGLRGRLRKFSRPSYRRVVKRLARLSAVGNWTFITLYLVYLVLILLSAWLDVF
jgi:serine/threonine protein kinase